MHQLPGAVFAPLPKVGVDGSPGWQVMGQQAPGTATARYVEDSVKDLAQAMYSGSSGVFRGGR